MSEKTIAELARTVEDATARHDAAKSEEQRASRAEFAARNALNEAQKAFDTAVDKMRADAKAGDWKDQKNLRVRLVGEADHD